MRSPNPLVAIGITTLVTVGAIHSGAAQASAPDSSSASELADSRQSPQSLSGKVTPRETRQTAPGDAPLVVMRLPNLEAQPEAVHPTLRSGSIAPGLLALVQQSKTGESRAVGNRKTNPGSIGNSELRAVEASNRADLDASLDSAIAQTSDAPAESAPANPSEQPDSPVVVPADEAAPSETSATETPATDAPTTEAPTSETPATETSTETSASEAPATETPASDSSTAQSAPAETPAPETSTPETPASGTSTPNAVPQPAPVETPAENTLIEPPPDAETTDTPTGPSTTPPATPSSIAPGTPTRVDVPDYLNPSPNPLDFPTRPEEVQLQGTQPVTLRQAVDLAIRNNPQLRQVRQQLDQSQAQLDQARAANNPTVSVNANLAQAGQESAVPITQPQFTVNSQGQLVPNPRAGESRTEIQSSDAATLSGNLEVSYALFTSGRRSSLIRAAEGQVRVQQLEIERQTNDLILQVATAYFDLQQAGAQVRIFQSNVAQAEQSLRDAEALERAGVGTRFDVLQAQVDVANAQQELTQQLSAFDVSRRNLSQLLNTSNAVDLTAADPIEVAGDWNLSLEQSIVEAFKNRAELEQQLIQRESAEQQRRAALAQLGPQVNLQGSFGLNNNLDAGNGFLNQYQVGVGVSLNVFDGGSARAQARAQETQIAQAESQFETLQTQIRFQTEQAYSQLQASATNIRTTELAVQQAAEALRLARLRFQAGVGTQTDVLRQQTVLAQSQVNNLQAILGYNRALVTLQRQLSNLPEGFLSDTP